MKYRKSYFVSINAIDYARLSYLELLINSLTGWGRNFMCQDVMDMRTRDWLIVPFLLLVLLVYPLIAYYEYKDIQKMSAQNKLNKDGWISYQHVYIYWRDVGDFSQKPNSYVAS